MSTKPQKNTPRRSPAGAVLYLVIALIAFGLDQWSKAAVLAKIPYGTSVPGLRGVFNLTNVRNTGAAWSMLSGHTGLLAWVSGAAILAIAAFLYFGKLCPAARLCLALVIGGAAGNMLDRVRLGFVVDMIDLSFMNYPVFNVGDSFIVVGGIAFALIYLFWNDDYLIRRGLLQVTDKGEQ